MDSYDTVLQRMQDEFRELSGFNADDASDIGIRLRILAGEMYSLWSGLEWLKRQAFPSTAEGAQLEEHALQRGLERKGAVCSQGSITFGREPALDYDVLIPAGTICATSGESGVQFVTTEDVTLKAGSLSVTAKARSAEGGAGTNAAEGKVNVLVSAPAGILSAINETAFTGGMDAESDEELRARILQSYAMISNGTNAEFYREAALKHDGVYSVGVQPRANGPGTVALYLGAKGAAASAEVIEEVRAELENLREINVDVQVSAATLAECTVSVYIKPLEQHTFESAKAAAEEAVREYFSGLAVGESVVLAFLGKKLLETGMITNYLFESALTQDTKVEVSQLAVASSIIVKEMEGTSV